MVENRLRELREDNDLLQKDVAGAIGITTRNYSYIETGTTALTDEILIKLAKFYKTSVDYLLYLTDEYKPYKKSIMQEDKKEKSSRVVKKDNTIFKIRTF